MDDRTQSQIAADTRRALDQVVARARVRANRPAAASIPRLPAQCPAAEAPIGRSPWLSSSSAPTGWVDSGILETSCRGELTSATGDDIRRHLAALLPHHPGADWLLDTIGAWPTAPGTRSAATAMFEAFGQHGGRHVALVVKSSAIGMTVSTVAFGLGLSIRIFESRGDALAYLRAASLGAA